MECDSFSEVTQHTPKSAAGDRRLHQKRSANWQAWGPFPGTCPIDDDDTIWVSQLHAQKKGVAGSPWFGLRGHLKMLPALARVAAIGLNTVKRK
jgi:hypothetical protein